MEPDGLPLAASLIVLAGGRGRRMERPKASLPAGSGSLLGMVITRLAPMFRETIVGGLTGTTPLDVVARVVPDVHPGAGPLAGIEAGLGAAAYPTAFVVGCDMPYVTPALARLLIDATAGYDAAVPRVGGRPEPVCAAYRASARSVLSGFLEAGGRRAAEALGLLRVRYVDEAELAMARIDPRILGSLNTVADY
ncbi:MAG: molybdenum cofactor guanylyltransferase, partial [Candidatus Limnocylindria bacterium]